NTNLLTSLTNHQDKTSVKVNNNHQDLNSKVTPDINRYIQQAYACFKQGDIEGGMAKFQNGISLYPHCFQLYTERGNFRMHQLRDLTGALEDYTQAIDINPR
ncbi:MAG: hypothetical protein ACKPFK_25770, partial [Dolichospermum sp.]